jgi:hypothetical protein
LDFIQKFDVVLIIFRRKTKINFRKNAGEKFFVSTLLAAASDKGRGGGGGGGGGGGDIRLVPQKRENDRGPLPPQDLEEAGW